MTNKYFNNRHKQLAFVRADGDEMDIDLSLIEAGFDLIDQQIVALQNAILAGAGSTMGVPPYLIQNAGVL